MDRRRLLKLLPLTAGLAGCTSESNPNESATESTKSPASTSTKATTKEPSSVLVQFRSSYRYAVNDDGIGVLSPEHDQFVFISPPVTDEEPDTDAFRLALGDEQFEAVSSVPGFASLTPGIEAVYTEDSKSGTLMFDVPTTETDAAALVYDGTSHPLADDGSERLATAPDFSLKEVSVPESVTPGDFIELSVAVENEGTSGGTYLAGFRTGGYPKEVDIFVEPGEEGTETVTYEAYDGSEAMYFQFDYPGGDRSYEVAIESETTTETE
ncbi:hypothetical protein [Halorussus amylolyticus]|uniref:hypothetical protein n=1 Tax=Halorussus amylolyticus TaxID=1126242 RepID=UPI00138F9764|nr:hypothetical protein [Halorussus amylolyticus]